jgi:hypothetical protein
MTSYGLATGLRKNSARSISLVQKLATMLTDVEILPTFGGGGTLSISVSGTLLRSPATDQ